MASKVHLSKGYHGYTLIDSHPAAARHAYNFNPMCARGDAVDSLVQRRRRHEIIGADVGTGKSGGLPPERVFAK